MARDNKPKKETKDPLVNCPRYSFCGTMVKQSQAGRPHTFTMMVDHEIKYFTCAD